MGDSNNEWLAIILAVLLVMTSDGKKVIKGYDVMVTKAVVKCNDDE
jgi:hypothetical protein